MHKSYRIHKSYSWSSKVSVLRLSYNYSEHTFCSKAISCNNILIVGLYIEDKYIKEYIKIICRVRDNQGDVRPPVMEISYKPPIEISNNVE